MRTICYDSRNTFVKHLPNTTKFCSNGIETCDRIGKISMPMYTYINKWCKNSHIHLSDLDDGRSRYSCGLDLSELKNGRLCSRFSLQNSSIWTPVGEKEKFRGVEYDLVNYLRRLVMDKIEVNGNFTYCRCRGQSCNSKEDSTIKCYSTPSIDEETQPIYSIPQLQSQKFFSEENLISCPRNITQCYRSGKRFFIFSHIVTL